MRQIKVLVVDDEKLIREAMAFLLAQDGNIEVVGQSANGREAYEYCASHPVDVVLMDIRMPEVDGVEGTRMIKESFPSIQVLILTTFSDTAYIQGAMSYGASGYLLKDSSTESIIDGICNVYEGSVVFHKKVSDLVFQKQPVRSNLSEYALNDGELTIIDLVAQGCSNKDIANTLYLSEGTVKNKISVILQKTYCRDRTQLAIFAFQKGIVAP